MLEHKHESICGGTLYRVWNQHHPELKAHLASGQSETQEFLRKTQELIEKATLWHRTVLIEDCRETFSPGGIASPEFSRAYDEMIRRASLDPPNEGTYYSATTLYGDYICHNIASEEECRKLVKEYQQTHGNPMVKLSVSKVIKQHHTIVEPIHGTL